MLRCKSCFEKVEQIKKEDKSVEECTHYCPNCDMELYLEETFDPYDIDQEELADLIEERFQ